MISCLHDHFLDDQLLSTPHLYFLYLGAEELAYQGDGYELGFLDVVSSHVKLITGEYAQNLESFWREKNDKEKQLH